MTVSYHIRWTPRHQVRSDRDKKHCFWPISMLAGHGHPVCQKYKKWSVEFCNYQAQYLSRTEATQSAEKLDNRPGGLQKHLQTTTPSKCLNYNYTAVNYPGWSKIINYNAFQWASSQQVVWVVLPFHKGYWMYWIPAEVSCYWIIKYHVRQPPTLNVLLCTCRGWWLPIRAYQPESSDYHMSCRRILSFFISNPRTDFYTPPLLPERLYSIFHQPVRLQVQRLYKVAHFLSLEGTCQCWNARWLKVATSSSWLPRCTLSALAMTPDHTLYL